MNARQPDGREAAPESVLLTRGKVRSDWLGTSKQLLPERLTALFGEARHALITEHLGSTEAGADAGVSVVEHVHESVKPLHGGERFEVEARVLEFDASHVHLFFQLWADKEIAAVGEELLRQGDASGQRPLEFPADVRGKIEGLHANQAGLPQPPKAGKVRLP
jgi:betainyl-CoA thioesterase